MNPNQVQNEDPRLDALLAEYLAAVDRGENPSADSFVADHPELAEPFRDFLAASARVERLAGPRPDETIDSPGRRSTGEHPSLELIRSFGEYDLLEEIARGGMGVVYKARQKRLGRVVAVKMILAGHLADDADVERFQAEAQAAASLHHAGIVAIHEVGCQQGQHFFSMEFIEGQSLAALVRDNPLPADRAAAYVAAVADAIGFAHERGVLHRDLKPSNILLDANDRPKVTDFGLAKRVGGSNLTATGAILGTPSYMPPEQAASDRGPVGPASDVYSLGAILYELVTGRPPFRAETPLDTVLQLLDTEPVAPRLLNARVPIDLETIILTCLAKDPRRRYGSARDLAADLDRFRRGEPIVARPIGPVGRLVKWAKRRPAVAGLLAALFVVVFIGFDGMTFLWLRAESQRAMANQASQVALESEGKARLAAEQEAQARIAEAELRRQAEAALRESERNLYFSRIGLAERHIQGANIARGEAILDQCPEKLRHFEWGYLKRLCHAETQSFTGHLAAVHPAGDRLAIAHGGTIEIHGFVDGTLLASIPTKSKTIHSLCYSPAGDRLAAAGPTTVQVFDAATGSELRSIVGSSFFAQVIQLAFHPAGEHLLVATIASAGSRGGYRPGGLFLWNLASGEKVGAFKDMGMSAAYAPDGRSFAALVNVGPRSHFLRVADFPSGQTRFTTAHHSEDTTDDGSVAFSPKGDQVATTRAGAVCLWDSSTGARIGQMKVDKGRLGPIAYSPDGLRLAAGGEGQEVVLWDLKTFERLAVYRGHTSDIIDLDFSPDGRWLLSSSTDETVRVWDTSAPPGIQSVAGRDPAAYAMVVAPDLGSYAEARQSSGSLALALTVKDTRSGAPRFPSLSFLLTGRYLETPIAFSGNGRYLALAVRSRTLVVLDAADGKEVASVPVAPGAVRAVAFDKTGAQLAAADAAGMLRVWSLPRGEEVFAADVPKVMDLVFSHDGSRLALAMMDKPRPKFLQPGTCRIVDVKTGAVQVEFKADAGIAHALPTAGVAFSPDDRLLATAGWDRVARLWDVQTGALKATLGGHQSYVNDVAFSNDSQRLATISFGNVLVWDVETASELLSVTTDKSNDRVHFAPDHSALVCEGRAASILVAVPSVPRP